MEKEEDKEEKRHEEEETEEGEEEEDDFFEKVSRANVFSRSKRPRPSKNHQFGRAGSHADEDTIVNERDRKPLLDLGSHPWIHEERYNKSCLGIHMNLEKLAKL